MDPHPLDRGVPEREVPGADLVKAYREWMFRLTTRADLTLKYRAKVAAPDGPGHQMWLAVDDNLIRATIGRAMNRINGHVLRPPRRSRKPPRLDALVWLERGWLTGRPHLHALIERPAFWPPEEFAKIVAKSWRAQPLAHRELVVQEVEDLPASLRYNMKADPKSGGNLAYFHKEPDERAWWRAEWLRGWNEAGGLDRTIEATGHAVRGPRLVLRREATHG